MMHLVTEMQFVTFLSIAYLLLVIYIYFFQSISVVIGCSLSTPSFSLDGVRNIEVRTKQLF